LLLSGGTGSTAAAIPACIGCTAAKSIRSVIKIDHHRIQRASKIDCLLRANPDTKVAIVRYGDDPRSSLHSAGGSGGMSKSYRAESERAGTLVVAEGFSQVPDVSERFISSIGSCWNTKSWPASITKKHRTHLRSRRCR